MEKMVKAGEWAVGQVNLVNVDDIMPTPDNNRVVDRDSDAFRELVASIKAVGVLQNLVGRPHPADQNMIDLRAGARRYAAALAAGLEAVPVRVLNLTDKEAMEVTMVENLHREQLTPLEEAGAIRKMLLAGYTEKEIAAKIDKPWTWVVRRNRLNELSQVWLDAMGPTAPFAAVLGHFGAAHLEILARYPSTTQETLLEEFKKNSWKVPKTASDLHDLLAQEERALGEVRWDLDDAFLVKKAGACSACTKRANCVPGLFDDREDPEAKDDRCLDDACFQKKLRAHVDRQIESTQAKYPESVLVTSGYQERKGAIPSFRWEKAKKSDKQAKPAVVVDGPQAGELIYVKLKGEADATVTVEKESARIQRERTAFIRAEKETAIQAMLRPDWFTLALALDVEDGGLAELMEARRKPTKEAELLDRAWERVLEVTINGISWGETTKAEEAFMVKELGLDLKGINERAKKKYPDAAPAADAKPKTKKKA